jgi:hypothetical protein
LVRPTFQPAWCGYTLRVTSKTFRTMLVAGLRSINASIYFFVDGFKFFRRSPRVFCSRK